MSDRLLLTDVEVEVRGPCCYDCTDIGGGRGVHFAEVCVRGKVNGHRVRPMRVPMWDASDELVEAAVEEAKRAIIRNAE